MNNNLPVVPNKIADSLINHSGVITQKIILIKKCSELQNCDRKNGARTVLNADRNENIRNYPGRP